MKDYQFFFILALLFRILNNQERSKLDLIFGIVFVVLATIDILISELPHPKG